MSENVESNVNQDPTDSPTDILAEGPSKPFARVKGRLVLPDGKPVKSGVVVFDPIPDRVHVTLPDGSSMIGSRVRLELDKDGRITSDENPYLDIVGCDTDGVTPAGVWSYLIRVSTGGITRRAVKSLKAGSSYDLSDLLSGKEEQSPSVAYEGLVRLIDERLKKFETDEDWPVLEEDFRDDGLHVQFGRSKPLHEAFDRSMRTVQVNLNSVVRLPERVSSIESVVNTFEGIPDDVKKLNAKTVTLTNSLNNMSRMMGQWPSGYEGTEVWQMLFALNVNDSSQSKATHDLAVRVKTVEDDYVTFDDIDQGLFGNLPYVDRTQDKPAAQYGAAQLGESFGVLARTVISADKDLYAIKNGPYRLSVGMENDPVEYDLNSALGYIGSVFADLPSKISNTVDNKISEDLRGEHGDLTRLQDEVDAVKNGPYKVSGLSPNGGRIEAVERDLARTMAHISVTIENIGGVIRNVAADEISKSLYGSEETGGIGSITEFAEAIANFDTRLKALEDTVSILDWHD